MRDQTTATTMIIIRAPMLAPEAAKIRFRSGRFIILNSGGTMDGGSDVDGDEERDVSAPCVVAGAPLLVMLTGIEDGGVVGGGDEGDPEVVVGTCVAPPKVDPGTDMSNAGLYSNFPLESSMILSPYLFPGGIVWESS